METGKERIVALQEDWEYETRMEVGKERIVALQEDWECKSSLEMRKDSLLEKECSSLAMCSSLLNEVEHLQFAVLAIFDS